MKLELKNRNGVTYLKQPYSEDHRYQNSEVALDKVLQHDCYLGLDILITYSFNRADKEVKVQAYRSDKRHSGAKLVDLSGFGIGRLYGLFKSDYDRIRDAGEELMEEIKSDIRREKLENMAEHSFNVKESNAEGESNE